MAVSKVIVDGNIIADISDATAVSSDTYKNIIAYGLAGERIIGNTQNGSVSNNYVNKILQNSKIATLEWTLPEDTTANLGYIYATNVTVYGAKTVAGTSPCTEITGILNLPDATTILGSAWTAANFKPTCVYCPNVTTLGASFLIGANPKPLVKLVISANPYNASNSLRNSSDLKAVVIKCSSVPALSQSSAVTNSGIGSNADGYIYVPKSLVNSYKEATNWSTFENKFRAIEDYPLIDAPDTWVPTEENEE